MISFLGGGLLCREEHCPWLPWDEWDTVCWVGTLGQQHTAAGPTSSPFPCLPGKYGLSGPSDPRMEPESRKQKDSVHLPQPGPKASQQDHNGDWERGPSTGGPGDCDWCLLPLLVVQDLMGTQATIRKKGFLLPGHGSSPGLLPCLISLSPHKA